VLLAAAGLSLTVANARESRDFEERAARVPGHVVDTRRDENAWRQHVTVQFTVDGETRLGRAPVLDSEVYRPGQSVVVLYEGERVLLDEERYDAASPALWWSAILVAGLLTMGMGWWWVHGCRRTAGAGGPAFAMEAEVTLDRPRWWNLRRPWVTLFPLHGTTPVGSYPLMVGVSISPTRSRLAAEVKGKVRDGGLVVARRAASDGQVLWPRGRLRT
jgi:hypothetical protein